MNKSIVSFKNVTYQYPDGTTALKNISLSIQKGKKIALIGNNGAGKSTLFLLLNGILKPSEGELFLQGKKITYTRKEIKALRQKVGIVFQNPDSQLFSTSVFEDIQFGPKNLKLTKEEIQETVEKAISLTETDTLKDKPPHFLSLGQKKRVAIAGIIAMGPELMILDEPTAGLDPYYSKKMMMILHELLDKDRTILLSTHSVDLAYEWADEIIVLHNGRILAHGPPVDVFKQKDILQTSHLTQPWVMEVYEHLTSRSDYPRSKEELFVKLSSIKS
ncbi:energy-coupling factor ABC transporter ATP-binding protein [Bacillus weihaiensis]|uniref:energy-coupling factor ABC transporter ATP-binding protein n=1 Tax=Bacillus weihaiensis TaxID=1547283 RepID=UPI002354F6AB|nr:ATP-binding cassette domain-containing protein [Bacillus weihaiensis]